MCVGLLRLFEALRCIIAVLMLLVRTTPIHATPPPKTQTLPTGGGADQRGEALAADGGGALQEQGVLGGNVAPGLGFTRGKACGHLMCWPAQWTVSSGGVAVAVFKAPNGGLD